MESYGDCEVDVFDIQDLYSVGISEKAAKQMEIQSESKLAAHTQEMKETVDSPVPSVPVPASAPAPKVLVVPIYPAPIKKPRNPRAKKDPASLPLTRSHRKLPIPIQPRPLLSETQQYKIILDSYIVPQEKSAEQLDKQRAKRKPAAVNNSNQKKFKTEENPPKVVETDSSRQSSLPKFVLPMPQNLFQTNKPNQKFLDLIAKAKKEEAMRTLNAANETARFFLGPWRPPRPSHSKVNEVSGSTSTTTPQLFTLAPTANSTPVGLAIAKLLNNVRIRTNQSISTSTSTQTSADEVNRRDKFMGSVEPLNLDPDMIV